MFFTVHVSMKNPKINKNIKRCCTDNFKIQSKDVNQMDRHSWHLATTKNYFILNKCKFSQMNVDALITSLKADSLTHNDRIMLKYQNLL